MIFCNRLFSFFHASAKKIPLLSIFTLFVSCHVLAHNGPHPTNENIDNSNQYRLSQQTYAIPNIPLIDLNGQAVSLLEELNTAEPVVLNFIFTSCTSICPVATATFSQVQEKLTKSGVDFKMISISIDPEQDTPNRLKEYSGRYKTSPRWKFFTGNLHDITIIQKAFNVYRGNKTNHLPLTFIKPSSSQSWYRIEGFTSASALLTEFTRLNTHTVQKHDVL